MEGENQNAKMMTEKQKDYIESLLQNQRIDEKYKRYVDRALQNGVTCLQASKIIDFLVSFIAFKKNFVRVRNGNNSDKSSFKKANFLNKDTGHDRAVVEHIK